jgi:hypothetical protein
MKKTLLSIAFIALAFIASAQCEANYDFGAEPFGVSPDPVLGESFEIAQVGASYTDIIHIKVPTQASDIDETLPQGAPIDSVQLLTVNFILGGTSYTLEQMGLSIACNNNGDSPDPCTFIGGNQYCAVLEGTPTTPGEFNLAIEVLGYTTVFGFSISQPVSFDQYTFVVNGPSATPKHENFTLSLGQNIPNPAIDSARIPVTLEKGGNVNFTVVNLLGEVVIAEQFRGHVGFNEFTVPVSQLSGGLYLYSIDVDGKRITKRMVINR